ncbi:MAG: aminopeptidase P N-terminal domain-containing protein [Neisseriales bacterium]|nr:MAG: aminopeptidase P N-terminal domain-containing protein [Neisseriales bacterium]
MDFFVKRREKLGCLLKSGVVILSNYCSDIKNRYTTTNIYNNYFFYLTGLTQYNSVFVLDIDANRTIFFGSDKEPQDELWSGSKPSPQEVAAKHGFDQAYDIAQLDHQLLKILSPHRPIYWQLGSNPTLDHQLTEYTKRSYSQDTTHHQDLINILDKMRLIKDEEERRCLKKAGKISALAHQWAIKTIRPDQYEYQVESELLYVFMQHGTKQTAYDSIVAAGKNACILHYSHNHAPIRKGELLLIDAGCKWQGYASDITRTVPVNGRFSTIQKTVYDIVLAAQQAAIEQIKPQASCQAIANAALNVLVQGMIDLKLLKGNIDNIIENKTYQQFYMHGIGHWLGLDVHDVGEKFSQPELRLVPNMCLTVEPGLYIRPHPDIPAALHHIGIRIEDNVFVTETGCEVYTADDAPKSVQAIEELMRDSS